jgi:hypothetical protein
MNGRRIESPFAADGGLIGEWPQPGDCSCRAMLRAEPEYVAALRMQKAGADLDRALCRVTQSQRSQSAAPQNQEPTP